MKYAIVLILGLITGLASGAPFMYFADENGNMITSLNAQLGDYVTVYIYGQTDSGNTYDVFNIGLDYDPAAITPKTGVASSDLVIDNTPYGDGFGYRETTYSDTYILCGSAGSMGDAPAGFGPTLLATAYFTFQGMDTQIGMFNEAGEYTYSTFFMDTNTFAEVRFSDALTITAIPEPATACILILAFLANIKRQKQSGMSYNTKVLTGERHD